MLQFYVSKLIFYLFIFLARLAEFCFKEEESFNAYFERLIVKNQMAGHMLPAWLELDSRDILNRRIKYMRFLTTFHCD
jgi:hypothetical protein